MNERKKKGGRRPKLYRLLPLLVALALFALTTGCGATKKATRDFPAVGSTVLMGLDGKPVGLVRYDLNRLVAFGIAKAELEIYLKGSGFPVLGPVYVDEHRAVVQVRDPEFKWTGPAAGRLPKEARPLFRDAEIAAWGIHFDDEDPSPPDAPQP